MTTSVKGGRTNFMCLKVRTSSLSRSTVVSQSLLYTCCVWQAYISNPTMHSVNSTKDTRLRVGVVMDALPEEAETTRVKKIKRTKIFRLLPIIKLF